MVIGEKKARSRREGGFQAFTPTWYAQLGYCPAFYGPLITTFVLASAVGTVGCGTLADRYGRRTVILGTLVLSAPAILLYTKFPGPWAFARRPSIGAGDGPGLRYRRDRGADQRSDRGPHRAAELADDPRHPCLGDDRHSVVPALPRRDGAARGQAAGGSAGSGSLTMGIVLTTGEQMEVAVRDDAAALAKLF